MQFLAALLPDADLIEMLVEESMPWFMAWCFVLTFVLVAIVVGNTIAKLKQPKSPVEKLLRRRGYGA